MTLRGNWRRNAARDLRLPQAPTRICLAQRCFGVSRAGRRRPQRHPRAKRRAAAAPQAPRQYAARGACAGAQRSSRVRSEVSLPSRPPPVETLPRLDRSAPVEVDKAIAPPDGFAAAAGAGKRAGSCRRLRARGVLATDGAARTDCAPGQSSASSRHPLNCVSARCLVVPRTPPAELKPREEPVPAAPADHVAPATVEREPTPAAEVRPRDCSMPPMPPIERLVPADHRAPVGASVELPAPRKRRRKPPRRLRRSRRPRREAAPATPPLPRSEPVEIAPGKVRTAPPAVTPQAAIGPGAARTEPRGREESCRVLTSGAPDVDEEVFRSRRDTRPRAPAAPGIYPAEYVARARREIANEGTGPRGVLEHRAAPPPVGRKDTLAEGIAKAAKPDCRTAYAGMGLLPSPLGGQHRREWRMPV